MSKKCISILIPCYNEQENVNPISKKIIDTMENLQQYNFEIIFIDNCSTDNTRILLRKLCENDKRIKCIFNIKNFGQFNSPYYGLCQTTGDCTILMSCDFQDPVEMIPELINKWEEGYAIVCAIKKSSKENKILRFFRSIYYKIIKRLSSIEQIEHFTGFGLYDACFRGILRELNDPLPFLRGIVAEFGFKKCEVYYEQPKRFAGKTHNNWYSLYDAAMLSFTSYTTFTLRIATIFGFILSLISILIALFYLILKFLFWDNFVAGITPILLCICILGSAQIFFIGFLGEYVITMNRRLMNRPLVIEETRINFEERCETDD